MDEYELYKKETGSLVITEHYLKDFYLKTIMFFCQKNKILKKFIFYFTKFFKKN